MPGDFGHPNDKDFLGISSPGNPIRKFECLGDTKVPGRTSKGCHKNTFKRNFENISVFKIRSTRCDDFPCTGVDENERARLR